VEGEVLVRFRSGTSARRAAGLAEGWRTSVRRSYPALSERLGEQVLLVRSSSESTEELMARLSGDSGVLEVIPNYVTRTAEVLPDDPRFSEQWGLRNLGETGGRASADIAAPAGWVRRTGSAASGDPVVVVMDTGIDDLHEDLTDNLWTCPPGVDSGPHGWDFVASDDDPTDENGHGTHCAGILGATGNNGRGIAGVNWRTRIMACRTLDAGGYGDMGRDLQAYDWLLARIGEGVPIRVLSASFGRGASSDMERDAIAALGNAGVLMVAAAGNDGTDNDRLPFYPSSYVLPNLVAVAATNASDDLAWFSDRGVTSVHLAAPGQDILSCALGTLGYVPASTDLFFDDMEGARHFTTGAVSGENLWALTTTESYSPSHSWCSSPGTSFVPNTRTWLALSGDLDLSARSAEPLTLGFRYLKRLDWGSTSVSVDFSGDGGATWHTALGFSDDDYYNWKLRNVRIPPGLRTRNFRFRFVVNAGDVMFSGLERAFFVDDAGVGVPVPSSGYRPLSGTSQATPFVSGAAVLLAEEFPGEGPAQLKRRLLAAVEPLSSLEGKILTGGRLRLDWALGASARSLPGVTPLSGEIAGSGGSLRPGTILLGAKAASLRSVSADLSSGDLSGTWSARSGDRLLSVSFAAPLSVDRVSSDIPRMLILSADLFVPSSDLIGVPLKAPSAGDPWPLLDGLKLIKEVRSGDRVVASADLIALARAYAANLGSQDFFVASADSSGIRIGFLLGVVDGAAAVSADPISAQPGWFLVYDGARDDRVTDPLKLEVARDEPVPTGTPAPTPGSDGSGGCDAGTGPAGLPLLPMGLFLYVRERRR
jgi:subtilisin family serine protease